MADKTPIRTVFTGSTATGLAEFQSGDTVGLTHGGIGVSLSIGSAGQVLKVNSGASALEFGNVEAVLNIDGMTDGSSITIADGDDFAISDGGTEKRVNASQIKTYVSAAPTITGTATMADLDISGDVDVDGTLETDALTINGATLAETISDTVGAMVGSNTETGITVTYEDGDNTLDFALGAAQTTITSLLATDIKIGEDDQTKIDFETADEIHFYAANVEQVYLGDNIFGPQSDSDVDLGSTGVRWKDAFVDSITVTGEVDAASLDISGDADIDGTLEADAITIAGVSLAETISDTVGAMVGSNTETGIGVTYDDSDNTLDFVLGAAQTTITSILATDLKIGEDDQTKIDFETADTIHFYAGNQNQIKIVDGAIVPITDNDIDLGTSSLEFKDAYFDGTVTADAFAGPLTGDVTGNVSGTAATVTTAAQSNITSLGTLTTLTVDNVITNGSTIGHTDDTDLMTVADGILTVAGEVSMTTLDIGGTNVTSTATELNFVDGVTSNVQTQMNTKSSKGFAFATSLIFG
jgi:cytoskeletal protein CcmA (bactofilin family)